MSEANRLTDNDSSKNSFNSPVPHYLDLDWPIAQQGVRSISTSIMDKSPAGNLDGAKSMDSQTRSPCEAAHGSSPVIPESTLTGVRPEDELTLIHVIDLIERVFENRKWAEISQGMKAKTGRRYPAHALKTAWAALRKRDFARIARDAINAEPLYLRGEHPFIEDPEGLAEGLAEALLASDPEEEGDSTEEEDSAGEIATSTAVASKETVGKVARKQASKPTTEDAKTGPAHKRTRMEPQTITTSTAEEGLRSLDDER